MSDQDDDVPEESLASRRSRRSLGDKGGKLAALEKLRNARKGGVKNKYEVKEVENVYDVVDEDTYSRKVNDRLQDDWIVDDGNLGYCETGHELFDDDLLDEDDYGPAAKRKAAKGKGKKDKQSKEEREHQKANFQSVRDMLTNMPVKRKRETAEESSSSATTAEADDFLGEMLEELKEGKKARTSTGITSGLKLIEKTKAVEKMISSVKIHEDKPFLASQKITMKKKFKAFEVKQEPMEYETQSHWGDESGFDGGTENIQEFNSEEIEVKIEPETKKPKMDAASNSTTIKVTPITQPSPAPLKEQQKGNFLPLQEVEDIEKYRQGEASSSATMDIGFDQETNKVEAMEESGDKTVLNFFWFDIYEEPRNPGFLYLFGKVASKSGTSGTYVSCCAVIKDVQRSVLFLPRESMEENGDTREVEFVDVNDEFEALAKKFKIPEYRVRKIEKKYCFGEENVPSMCQYLEACYSGTLPPLPENLQGRTFSRVFGTHSSLLENFLLTKKFKGPSWLQITNPIPVDSSQQQSWCKMEFTCQVKNIEISTQRNLTIPPFVVASLNINSVHDAASKKDTIIAASVVVNRTFKIQSSSTTEGLFHESFCLLNKPPGEVWPFDVDRILNKTTSKMDSERGMLACLLAKLTQFDPDIYVGHDLNFDLLLLQLWNHKVPHWSRIGRLKRTTQPQKGSKMPDIKSVLAGRLACDVKVSAMELIRARSYDLSSLACQVLGLGEDQVCSYTGTELRQLFETSEGIQHLSAWGMSQSILNLRLVNELQVMPLALQITTIAGNTLSRTLMGGRSERNEFLLLHAFYNKGYIVPDKQYRKNFNKKEDDEAGGNSKEKKGKSGGPSYVGGLVLDPKKGFYDNFIVLMDFNSLYPSIIQEFNICFTTSTSEAYTDDTTKGILPEEIRKLVESRREVKKLMKNEKLSIELSRQYDIRQKALKLTANSMYGCLGFRNSRFYAQNLAALITGKGRDILMTTKDAVEKMGFEVIYGDTDSLMINTNSTDIQKVYQIGNKIKSEINRLYRLLELEIDGVFRFLLLLKKKKYAALTYTVKSNGEIETAMELKGLDIVRRDWAPVAATTARAILDEIMTEQALDDKIYKIVKILTDKAVELRAGTVPMKDLLITKQLAKNPEEYKDRQGQYHVRVALQMNQSGRLPKKFRNGDTVPYLFCTDGLPHHPAELLESKVKVKADVKVEDEVKPPQSETEPNSSSTVTKTEVKQDEALVADAVYYLSQQVHPVVSRICEPIPGLDAARIAEALGLDPTSYKKRRVVEQDNENVGLGEQTDAEKYMNCERFKFHCANKNCRQEITLDSPFTTVNGELVLTLEKCPGCSQSPFSYMTYIYNQLVIFMRKCIEKYYKGWYMCEDPACTNRERAINLRLDKGFMVCPCQQGLMIKEYTDMDLNKQLNYLLSVFNFAKHYDELSSSQKQRFNPSDINLVAEKFAYLTMIVNKQLNRSAYSQMKLGEMFSELIPKMHKFSLKINCDYDE